MQFLCFSPQKSFLESPKESTPRRRLDMNNRFKIYSIVLSEFFSDSMYLIDFFVPSVLDKSFQMY